MDNIFWNKFKITNTQHAMKLKQNPFVLWFTGLSGAGKTSIADIVEQKLFFLGKNTYILDGDNLRHGLNSDLSFSEKDRSENIRRAGEVSKILVDAGIIVLASFISPYEKDRQFVRNLFPDNVFFEIFVDASLETCMKRDKKNLYSQSLMGKIKNMTGMTSSYEKPKKPDLILKSDKYSVLELSEELLLFLGKKNLI